MSARQVHAVLAHGVQNPHVIARWQENPSCLQKWGISPNAMDLTALWKFAGLSTKVRHNGLLAAYPLSFRLMRIAELEIPIFASYATHCAELGRKLSASTEERANDLINFLSNWLDFAIKEHTFLFDLFRHEHALAEISRSTSSPSAAPGIKAADRISTRKPESVPHIRGKVILHSLRSDPLAMKRALFQRPVCLDQIDLGAFHFCYWLPNGATEISIAQLDEAGFYVLTLVDGSRSIRSINRALGGPARLGARFLDVISQLAKTGFIGFETCEFAQCK